MNTRKTCRGGSVLVLACGLASGLGSGAAWADGAGRAGGFNEATPEDIAAVRATFMDASLADVPAPAKAPVEAPAPRAMKLTAWESFTPTIDAALRSEPQPSYYVYRDRAIRMALDGDRVAVQMNPGSGEAEVRAAAAAAGLAVLKVSDLSVQGWFLVDVANPARTPVDAEARVMALAARPGVAFASPVFNHPEVVGGWMVPTRAINARVKQADLGRAGAIVAQIAPDLRVLTDELGKLPGAYQLGVGENNGFEAMRRANALAESGQMAWAEPDFLQSAELHFIPNDPSFNNSWGLRNVAQFVGAVNDIDTDADEAWDYTIGRPSIVTLVMDCGVEQNHPDINQNPGRDFTTGAVGGVAGGGPTTLCDRHGTPVAGIISGRINNALGTAGVAPGTRTISAKTATEQINPCSSQYAAFSGSWVANALAWGLSQGAVISNSSFGVGQSVTLDNAYANADNNGMINFASSGNGGADGVGDPTIGYPARAAGVQAVGAIDFDGGRSSFSNWGTELQFSLPGTNVYTCDRQDALGYNSSSDYAYFGGTSAASPFAAGVAALIWSVRPDLFPNSVLSLMRTTARDLGPAGFETDFGWGLPNLRSAIDFNTVANDWCTTATDINVAAYNPAPFSTSGYVEVPDEPQESCEANGVGVSHTVWYRFTPPCTGTIDINTTGSNYDTVLAVFRGTCRSPIAVACNDDFGGGLQSQLTGVGVAAGLTYYIKVSGYGSASGTLDFNFVYDAPAVSNDSCTNPRVIPSTSTAYSDGPYCISAATVSVCEVGETCETTNAGISHSVWYGFTPRYSGRVSINTNGSSYDTVLSVWDGCAQIILNPNNTITCITGLVNQLACNNDGGTGNASAISGLKLLRGESHRIKVSANGSTNEGGSLDFNLTYVPCPADHDGNGTRNPTDIFEMLDDYFAGIGDTDYNNDAVRSPTDIFTFLNLYFAGCPGF